MIWRIVGIFIQARDPSQAPGSINEKVTIIIKTLRRHSCLDRLVKSIRKYYPDISIIIADDSPGNDQKYLFMNYDELSNPASVLIGQLSAILC